MDIFRKPRILDSTNDLKYYRIVGGSIPSGNYTDLYLPDISGSATLATTTYVDEVSGNLQSQIDAVEGSDVDSINGLISDIDIVSNQSTITITPSGQEINIDVDDYISATEVYSISADLQTNINNISANYSTNVYVNEISGNLFNDIYNIDLDLQTQIIDICANYATTTYVEEVSGNLQNQISSNDNDISDLQTDVENISANYQENPNTSPITTDTTASYDQYLLVDTSSGDVEITLPEPNINETIFIMRYSQDANDLLVTPSSGTINGNSNIYIINKYDAINLLGTGSEWIIK